MRWFLSPSMAACLGCALACTTAPTRTQPPSNNVAPPQPPQLPQPEERFIHLDLDEGLTPCKVTEAHFAFDSARARLLDHDDLHQLAQCLNAPERRQMQLILLGQTDASGSREYNEELGRERAQFVKNALIHYGLDADRMEIVSLGESTAHPTSQGEDGRNPADRRVDVVQIGIVHAPQ